ncbi:hypothetical protein AVEN_273374-1 [Araneus ventricosus]|uniref:Uncharacterized protein n=1 Tax=Araneus ventricosus TaxID=182803 RepID=A0A4Y2JV34_ARAVE|nr:hypothetical protein AVEN_273374-1 [Araneus ventricosus]
MERRKWKAKNRWLMRCPGCQIPACSDDPHEVGSTSQESIPVCSVDANEAGPTNQECIPVCSVDANEAANFVRTTTEQTGDLKEKGKKKYKNK